MVVNVTVSYMLLLELVFGYVKQDSFEQMLKLQRMLVGQPEIVKAGRVSVTVDH